MITVITGLGRCGSSLTMQMLRAGGMPIYADGEARYLFTETSKMLWLPTRSDWLRECEGHAVKIIDPHIYKMPRRKYPFRFIWLSRDLTEQARSQIKFLRAGGEKIEGKSEAAILNCWKQTIHQETRQALNEIAAHETKVMTIRFEELIEIPDFTARRIADFLTDVQLNVPAMASAVVKRPTECLPYLLEDRMLKEAIRRGKMEP